MKSTLIAFGIASVAISMSFAQQSSGNSAAGAGTSAPGSNVDRDDPLEQPEHAESARVLKPNRNGESERSIEYGWLIECPYSRRSRAEQDGLHRRQPGRDSAGCSWDPFGNSRTNAGCRP